MRKILTILFSLISIVGYSQFPSSPNQGNVNTKNNVLGAMDINKGVVIGYFTDTTAANSATWTSGVPYITITTSDNAIWQRNSTATRWVQISGSGSTSCGVQIGGVVTWDSLLVFSVSASDNYCINNTSYTSAGGTITLDAADPSLPRLDIIGFDTTGAVIKITGTPSSDPQLPQIDANSQYFLTYVLVGAGATTPSNTSQQVVWDENTGSPEWVGSSSGLTVDFDYSANPVNVYHLTKSTNVGAFTNNDIVSYTGDNYSLNTYNSLRFFIKLKSNLNANANISVSLLSNGIPFTSPLVLGVNQGFSKNITSVFQNISIPLSLFAWISDPAQINGVRLTMNGSNANGFYVDYITLQGGIFNGGGNTGNFLEDVYASNDSLYKVKNGIHTFWYKVPSASTDTTVAKFPLYVIQTLGEKDSIGVYGVDSSYQNAIIRSDSLVLHRFNGDSTVLPVGGTIDTTNLHGRGVAYYQLEGDSAVLTLNDSSKYSVAIGGGGGTQTYLTQNAGILLDSLTTPNTYGVGVDTSNALVLSRVRAANTYLDKTTPQSAYTVFGRGSGSGAPSFLSLDSSWLTGMHTQQYYDLRYAKINNSAWSLSGNALVDSATQYLGTTDLKPFQIKTDGITRLLFTQDGKTTITSPLPYSLGYINLNGSTNIKGRLSLEMINGTRNVGIGITALNSVNGSGSDNIGIGYDAAQAITGGTGNIAIGRSSFIFLAGNQNYNIGLGYNTGYTQTSGSYNIAIGAGACNTSTTGSGQLNIGNVIYGENIRQNSYHSSTAQTNGRIGINTNAPNASAVLDLKSTTQGFLQPRMTTTQKNAISSPANGLSVYDTDTKQPNYYDGVTWKAQVGMTFGTAAPAITPAAIGNFFLDTTNKKLYVSTGTASSADWNILN